MFSTNPGPLSETTQRVGHETVQKAVKSLLKWRYSQSQAQKPQLLEEEEFVYLILTLKKIPNARTNPYKILLPHSLHSEFSERCLFIDDRHKSNLSKEAAQKKIQSENIPISKTIKLSKLKSNYRPFEAKRKLCDSYEMFFSDKRIIQLLPKLLGKHFFKKKKIPVPLDLSHKNWKEQIEKACGSALLYLRTGTCSVVKVARASMNAEEIVENVAAAINGIAEIIPGKWGNVRSFHLKLLDSVALPIYQTVPDMKFKIEGVKEKNMKGASKGNDENESNEQKDKNAGKKKKGRIHEVRYLDNNVGEIFDEDELGSDEDDKNIDEVNDIENDVKGSEILGGKKRKKGDKVKEGALSELNAKKLKKSSPLKSKEGVKQKKDKSGLSVKGDDLKSKESELNGKKLKKSSALKSLESVKQEKDKSGLSVKGDDSVGKKEKKSGISKLKAGGTKVKVKKGKKAVE